MSNNGQQATPRTARLTPRKAAVDTSGVPPTVEFSSACPVQAFEPKIVAPGNVPKRVSLFVTFFTEGCKQWKSNTLQVEIERKKRLYLAQDINELLAKENIPEYIGDSNDERFKPFLPLEAFDDTEFDVSDTNDPKISNSILAQSRSPEEWIHLGYDEAVNQKTFVPARAIRDISEPKNWVKCRVLSYSSEKRWNNWEVQWEDTKETMWLPRLRILFYGEDPFNFARRVASAYNLRKSAESTLRYNLYVDSMPADGINPLTSEQLSRILAYSVNTRKLKVCCVSI